MLDYSFTQQKEISMSYAFKAVSGQQFGRWTVLTGESIGNEKHSLRVRCRCDCGELRDVLYDSLRSGVSKSCGCLTKEVSREPKSHGMTGHPTLRTYSKMKDRCLNENADHYHRYGGRGITVCDRWLNPENFLEDMLPTWFEGATLERKDNDKGYCLENCIWATRKTQANNRSTNNLITYKGVTKNITQWEEDLGMNRGTISSRLYRGLPLDKIFNVKVSTKNLTYEGFGEKHSIPEWATLSGVKYYTLFKRIRSQGLSVEDAVGASYKPKPRED